MSKKKQNLKKINKVMFNIQKIDCRKKIQDLYFYHSHHYSNLFSTTIGVDVCKPVTRDINSR